MSQSFVVASRVSLASLVVAAGMWGCSSEDDGGNAPPPFGSAGTNGGVQGGVGGAGSSINNPGGNAGTSNVDGMMPNGIAGGGGNGSTIGGQGGSGGAVDVITEPGPGFFSTGDWRGYAWTAIETDPVQGATTRSVLDFTNVMPGQPYCLSGTVAADPPSSATANDGYQSFAMMGFNLNQAGVPETPGAEPLVGTTVPTSTGLAFTIDQNAGPLRVQIQGPNPADATQRWCATVAPSADGRGFIRWDQFHNTCYAAAPLPQAGFYGNGGTRAPISALSFQVPGDIVPVPYDFCVAGFADAADVSGAPASISGGGLVSGVLSSAFGRAKVIGRDGKSYVVQNNAWNPGVQPNSHSISFEGNSFTVTRQTNGGFGSIPISFPSIFVGRNGFRGANDLFTTTADDGLPRAINAITSINSTLAHNGGNGPQGEYNVTYDIWFANTPPAGEYEDAAAAFLMVWLYKPGGKNPIGLNPFERNVSIPGAPGTWDIWVGRRGENGAEDNLNDNAPVISYTPTATIANFNANLLSFINDAVTRSNNNDLNGFTFGANLVLTDIFGGMEIWSGGQGLQVSNFSVNVQ